MNLKNVVTQFGPMSGFEVIKQLVKLVGAEAVRQAVDEIDGGEVLGHQIVVDDSWIDKDDWKLVSHSS